MYLKSDKFWSLLHPEIITSGFIIKASIGALKYFEVLKIANYDRYGSPDNATIFPW